MGKAMKSRSASKATMLWKAGQKAGVKPVINDQFVAIGNAALCLRHPWTAVSALMGKLWSTSLFFIGPSFVFQFWPILGVVEGAYLLFFILMPVPTLFALLLWSHIHMLKRRSHFYFNRHTQRVYYNDGKYLWIGDWSGIQGGSTSATDVTNVGAVIRYYLELQLPNLGALLPPDRYDETRTPRPAPSPMILQIDSNQGTLGLQQYIAEVWEYIRIFMEEGPRDIPIPSEENWWESPCYRTYLTPMEALRRYVPWRAGEPGEKQGKKWWLLPFWALLFPYNMVLSLCWWITCVVFKVRPAAPPPEAFEGQEGPMVTIQMAAKGIRP